MHPDALILPAQLLVRLAKTRTRKEKETTEKMVLLPERAKSLEKEPLLPREALLTSEPLLGLRRVAARARAVEDTT